MKKRLRYGSAGMVKPSLFIKSEPYNNVVILASDSVISISLRKGIFATGISGILYLSCSSNYIYFYMYRITLYKEINEIYAFIKYFFSFCSNWNMDKMPDVMLLKRQKILLKTDSNQYMHVSSLLYTRVSGGVQIQCSDFGIGMG